MKTRTIRVQGKGNVSQAPDRLRIVFTISETKMEFAEAVEGCNERTDAIRRAVSGVALPEGDLKTASFDIREVQEYRNGRRFHDGFEAIHRLAIEVPIDKPLIGRLLSAVIRGKAKPEVNLIFTVSDAEELKQRVLADAVANAKRRAETIAQAASLKLGVIENIEYGYSEIRVSSEPCGMAIQSVAEADPGLSPDIEPEDVEAEDTVTITWALSE